MLGLWLAAGVGGAAYLADYAARPAPLAEITPIWPSDTTITRQPGRSTLVMFVHPKCPCSRASLRELERLLVTASGAMDATVAVIQPPNTHEAWPRTDIWQSAKDIPSVHVVLDREGQEALRFGAHTSGEVALYDAAGNLVFHGGLTPARGHEGDNAGSAAIVRWIRHQPSAICSPTFGCPLAESMATLPAR